MDSDEGSQFDLISDAFRSNIRNIRASFHHMGENQMYDNMGYTHNIANKNATQQKFIRRKVAKRVFSPISTLHPQIKQRLQTTRKFVREPKKLPSPVKEEI